MDFLATTITRNWLSSLNWNRWSVWQDLLPSLTDCQQQHRFPFGEARSEAFFLGRLYGYVYARTEGTGLSKRSRRQLTQELISELLMLPCEHNRLAFYTCHPVPDFLRGLAEGRRVGRPRPPLNNTDALYDALLDAMHRQPDDHENPPH